MRRLFISLLFIVSILTACSAPAVYRVNSLEENKDYYEGREIASVTNGGIQTIINFEGQSGPDAIYYLHVQNESETNLLFDPAKIYAVEKGNGKKLTVKAVNPEKQIRGIEKDMAHEKNVHKVNTGLNCLSATFGVIGGIMSGDNAAEKIGRAAGETAGFIFDTAVEEDQHDKTMDMLNGSREYWKNEVFRITTIPPGEGIGGLVYIPNDNREKRFEVIVPVEGMEHRYLFEQVKVN